MTRWVRIASLAEIPDGGRRSIEIGVLEITVLRGPDGVVALRNRCPHANGRLGDGMIQDGRIVCPLHKWPFDLRTGATRRDRKLAATIYPVRVEAGDVWVELPDAAPDGSPPAATR